MTRRITIARDVRAEPTRAYAAWTTAADLAQWWWPHIADTVYEVDARPGGRYSIVSLAAGIGVEGEFLTLDDAREIVMTWRWLDDGLRAAVDETVGVVFSPLAGGTRVMVRHDLADSAGDGEDLRRGWEDVLDRLAEWL
jgi:uncharacterized protein YndB with AHSA1/START domain